MLRGRAKYRSVVNEAAQVIDGYINAKLTTALNPYNLTKTNDAFAQFRFETRAGDAWSGDYPGNPAIRAELELRTPRPLTYGVSIWISFWQRLVCPPEAGRAHCVVGQMHGGFDRAPVFSYNANPQGLFEIQTIKQTNASNWQYVTQHTDAVGTDGDKHHYVNRLLLHTNGDGTGNGELDVWRDGQQLLGLRNIAFGYLNDPPPYYKTGIYIKPDMMRATCVAEYGNIMGPTTSSLLTLVDNPQVENL